MNTKSITRFEVIDHREHKIGHNGEDIFIPVEDRGRKLVAYDVGVMVSLQDTGRTLKVMLTNRETMK
jgi:hypothetical protein